MNVERIAARHDILRRHFPPSRCHEGRQHPAMLAAIVSLRELRHHKGTCQHVCSR